MFLKDHADFLTTHCLGALRTFKMWFDEYFVNLQHYNCETNMKMYLETVNVPTNSSSHGKKTCYIIASFELSLLATNHYQCD